MAEKKEAPTTRVEVVRDFWDANCVRVSAGTIVEMDVDDAMEGVESGAFKRIPKEVK